VTGYLLDTNVISELRKRRPSASVTKWVGQAPETSLYVSVISLGELRIGIELVADSKKRLELERWLVFELTPRFAERVLSFDRTVADRWGVLEAQARRNGRRLPAIDTMLAATALALGLTLVTRNTRDFAQTGAAILNPWY